MSKRRSARRLRASALGMAVAAAASLAASPTLAGICQLAVHHSNLGARGAESDTVFQKEDQFQVCFRATKAGFVTLWDRIPTDGPVERLVPNENFTGEGGKAAKVTAGEMRCFGDGSDGYYLVMDPADGDGLGLMWLVFTDVEEGHPELASFSTPNEFAKEYSRFGAGSIKASRPEVQENTDACVDAKSSVQYLYRVSP